MRLSFLLMLLAAIIGEIFAQNVKLNEIESIKHEIECYSGKSCEYNPDIDLDTVQIATRWGYRAESHLVVTEDGYILTLHRILGPRSGALGGQPVFLQHGLLSSSTDWVDEGNGSLAFMLADRGYDVWMGNARGNTYSKAHVALDVHSAQFWNFSWHEMGVYDLPAALYHVSNVTGRPGEIIYIGHSMGGTMFFVFASLCVEAAKNVAFMGGMAPAAFMTHVRSPIRYLTPFTYDFAFIAKFIGWNEFLPNMKMLKFLAKDCEVLDHAAGVCEDLVFIFGGFNKEEMNPVAIPVIIAHDPAGSSTRSVLHYSQEIKNDGLFRQYDYGAKGNLVKYGSETPPEYNLTKVEVPTFLMYGMGDSLASYIDVIRLGNALPKNVASYEVQLKSFNHVDFLFGIHAPKLVYEPLIKMMQRYKSMDTFKAGTLQLV